MKGSFRGVALRIRVMTIFSAAFLLGAIVIFGIASLAGASLRVGDLSLERRLEFAAAGLVVLALVDLLALKRGRYCPLGLLRQTPKSLMRRYAATIVVAAWGFDTGLAVTTIRVAAITWGALVMTGLGLSSWWIGLGYAFGFVVPLLILLLTQTPDHLSNAQTSFGFRMEGLLKKRAIVQSGSAGVLLVAGAVLLVHLFI